MALRCRRVMRAWPVLAGLALWAQCAIGHAASASPVLPNTERLAQVDAIRTTDHARFVEKLAELRRDADGLTAPEKRYLRYLEGWEANYEGRYPEAASMFQAIVDESDDDPVSVRATAMLMNNMISRGKYAEAYAMATRAEDALDLVTDPQARFMLLANLAQMLTFAGQPDQALQYADMMLKNPPAGQSPCQGMVQKVVALEGLRQLTSQSPELKATIANCTADRQPIFVNVVSLVLVDRLLSENKPAEALAVVDRIGPVIRASNYFPQLIDLASARSRIYEQMGNATEARKAALEVVAMSNPDDVSESLRFAYRVLYSLEKAKGHDASALDYYEHYVVQDQGYLRDANVRNAAYQAASQHFRAEKLETEGLSKENRILRLQRALDAKAVETSRLYMVVMFLVLLSILFWMVRIKRSQLRFKWLSSCDGLTGIFNHQHFMSESTRVLQSLDRRSGECCLVFLDLDRFKQVNDTHGHAAGDAVLKHAVAICKAQLRSADLLGRLGGEEFGILLVDTPRLQGSVVAERIRIALAASPVVMDDLVIAFSASIGLASIDRTGYDLQRLCRASDAALYQAKNMGRNRVVIDGEGGSQAPLARVYETSSGLT